MVERDGTTIRGGGQNVSLPEWKSFVLQQVAYINKLSIPIGKSRTTAAAAEKVRIKVRCRVCDFSLFLVPGNWLLLKNALAVNAWKQ